ncbi:MAG: S-adenosylmethionine:tRNA ribosyltransferase-isomerase, partial [Omnitrophica WOR_2 bacterium]
YMKLNGLNELSGYTRIMIIPGYKFRICKALITNFHQPQSTLLLLVAAFVGENWKKAYNHALQNDYRFLSYGDSCLFFLQS